ncbi:MAG TPA: excinuclease ABC subunit UvrB [Acidobacteriota bacterium]|jgi:excinuclease ABC subunit B|nr:excinuclease ABC subunit UvrB [Acidobacteriota bacterium]
MSQFQISDEFKPRGDQQQAIEQLREGLLKGEKHQTLLGVTGSGKTFTIANVIAQVNKPALVIAPNKTLAAQLYQEFRRFFPDNAVEYFVSYYDYYQPEAYVPATDLYIEKEVLINEEIDRMRLAATAALFERRDTIIVASVSCIYGLGSPDAFFSMLLFLESGVKKTQREIIERLGELQYQRGHGELRRGYFRVRGDVIEVQPSYQESAIRIELFDDVIENITEFDPEVNRKIRTLRRAIVFPKSHYVTPADRLTRAMAGIRQELKDRLAEFDGQGKVLEAQRLHQRTMYDLEMLKATGFCHGIENYSRHLDGRLPGQPPSTLIDYFSRDFLLIIDESHVTVPQIRGMYEGDRSRKQTLVEHGFRLPSALDNRPLNFGEFQSRVNQALYVSATPGPYELDKSLGVVVQQIVRPTGLIDPEIVIKPIKGQMDDLLHQIKVRAARNERVLVTTLTKKMAEDLTEFLSEYGVRVRFLHSEVDTLDRVVVLRDLRRGVFDALVGVNLLREGLDLPEVSLVAILDADKEGFLRSTTSLIQTSGRAARNLNGQVIMYANVITGSMQEAMAEMNRRREVQMKYNQDHGITPESVKKAIGDALTNVEEADYYTIPIQDDAEFAELRSIPEIHALIEQLETEMKNAAANLEFEQAAQLRDKLKRLKEKEISILQ